MTPKPKNENLGITPPRPAKSNMSAHLGGRDAQGSNTENAENTTGAPAGASTAADTGTSSQTGQQLPSRIGAGGGTGASTTSGTGPFGGSFGLFQNSGHSQATKSGTNVAGASVSEKPSLFSGALAGKDGTSPDFSSIWDGPGIANTQSTGSDTNARTSTGGRPSLFSGFSHNGPFAGSTANRSNPNLLPSKPPACQSGTEPGIGNTGGSTSIGNQPTSSFFAAANQQPGNHQVPSPDLFANNPYSYPNYGTRTVPFTPIIRSCGIERSASSGYLEPGRDIFYSINFQVPYEDYSFEELRCADYWNGLRYGPTVGPTPVPVYQSEFQVAMMREHFDALLNHGSGPSGAGQPVPGQLLHHDRFGKSPISANMPQFAGSSVNNPPANTLSNPNSPHSGHPVHSGGQAVHLAASGPPLNQQVLAPPQAQQQSRDSREAELEEQNAALSREVERLKQILVGKGIDPESTTGSQALVKHSAGIPPFAFTPLSYNTQSSASSTGSARGGSHDPDRSGSDISPALITGVNVPAVPPTTSAWMSSTQAMPRLKDPNEHAINSETVQQHESQIKDIKTEIENVKVEVAGLKAQVQYLTGEKQKDPEQQENSKKTANWDPGTTESSRAPSTGEQSQPGAGRKPAGSP
ncbi:MAG: hypothetical protein M1831_001879 [Alyxoria varia]|nr:MAG: hypothetical protein M1831_001879 [Alyxoria varia]